MILLSIAFAAIVGVAAWIAASRHAYTKHRATDVRLGVVEQALANASICVFAYDIERRTLATTLVGAELHVGARSIGSKTIATVKAEQWFATVHPEDRERSEQLVANAVKTAEPYVLDYRVVLPDGRIRWLRSHGLPIKSSDGNVMAIYGTTAEISQIKHLEQEVRARDERFRDAAIAASFHTWELDLDKNTYKADRPSAKKRDSQDEWTSGNDTYTLTIDQANFYAHPDDVQIRKDMIERIRREDVPYETEMRVKNGATAEYRWRLSRGKIMRDANGRKYAVRGIILDIHDRKAAELKLKEAEARLERATRATNDGLWEYDLVTHSFWVSACFAEMLGYTAEDFVADKRKVYDITHPDDSKIIFAAFDRHLKHAEPIDIEVRKKTKSGEWRWYRVRGAAERDEHGNARTISGSQQDVNEKRVYQAALIEATESAAAASKAKSEFLANMSHEIRTPMNGVIGMTELLLETSLDPLQREYAQTARDSATALLTVINDILDFSKVEAGQLKLEYLDMDLRDTIEDVMRLLEIHARPKGLEVTALIDPSLPDSVRGDAGRIRQVLLNLGGNAVKFTRQGEVTIECKVVESTPQHTIVRCEVRDTGIGIPQNRLDALFQAFEQVDASTTRKFGGTGLGLSISKRLVELMGGEVGATSQEGRGSTFWFTLRLDAAQTTGENRPGPAATLKGRRILVVDDNATSCKIIANQVESYGMQPVSIGSIDDGIAALRQAAADGEPFEIVLLDQQTPGCDSDKLGALIGSDPALKPTRFILLTASGQRGDGQTFAELGFAGYLLKPVAQRDLADCLSTVLSAAAESWHMKTQPIVTRHALRTQRAQTKYRILLAEDNAVNQKVACHTLEKLGYRVDVVADGANAIKAWATGRYDLILMDCQMPVMDGYQATRQIRAQEKDGKRIPIVALTAHAMKGADTECTAAGMDDYLSKPIDRTQLQTCLERQLNAETTPTLHTVDRTVAMQESPIDWQRLLQATGNDEELARELATLFIDSGVSSVQAIIGALESGDYGTLGEKAHELKSSSANLQAAAATAAAERLEAAVRDGNSPQVPELTRQLQHEVGRAIEFLRARIAVQR